nr:CBS domain-containing protein [Gluconacetobacter dulcium]
MHILNDKGPTVITVGVEEPVTAIARLLAERHIGAVPVVDTAGHLAGMVSERSIVDALAHHGARIEGLTARDIMTREVPTATRSEDIHSVARKMTRRHSRHVPVLDGSGHLVGLVSIGDIVRMRLEEAESLAREMRAYVMQESSHAPMPPQPFVS